MMTCLSLTMWCIQVRKKCVALVSEKIFHCFIDLGISVCQAKTSWLRYEHPCCSKMELCEHTLHCDSCIHECRSTKAHTLHHSRPLDYIYIAHVQYAAHSDKGHFHLTRRLVYCLLVDVRPFMCKTSHTMCMNCWHLAAMVSQHFWPFPVCCVCQIRFRLWIIFI